MFLIQQVCFLFLLGLNKTFKWISTLVKQIFSTSCLTEVPIILSSKFNGRAFKAQDKFKKGTLLPASRSCDMGIVLLDSDLKSLYLRSSSTDAPATPERHYLHGSFGKASLILYDPVSAPA